MEGLKDPVIVIGGGASGIMAAISARRNGSQAVICERMNVLGKKILASGNGRCNLSNDNLDPACYNPSARKAVSSVLSEFGGGSIRSFFSGIGLKLCSDSGRIFPATNQASSVTRMLELELKRLSVPVIYDFHAVKISGNKGGFTVSAKSGRKVSGKAVVLAGGGRSYPSLGSDGSAYLLARETGHSIVEPVPAAVPLIVKDEFCHKLQGQKISAHVKCFVACKSSGEACGDLLFTKYGLSGTSILDVSDSASIAINRNGLKDVMLSVDMVPFMEMSELEAELTGRVSRKTASEDLIAGILPNKFSAVLKDILATGDSLFIAKSLKEKVFKVTGTRGWNEADFTAGGVDFKDIKYDTLESLIRNGIYFAGELLDVNGRRGGYNLAWAWASGYVAGLGASNA